MRQQIRRRGLVCYRLSTEHNGLIDRRNAPSNAQINDLDETSRTVAAGEYSFFDQILKTGATETRCSA
ncbi:MAG: hypothetical protein WBR56_16240 [Sedimenticolaceae bacterium]